MLKIDSAQLKKFRLMLCWIIILPKYPFWSEGSLQISFFLLRNFTKNSNTVSLDGCSLRVEIRFCEAGTKPVWKMLEPLARFRRSFFGNGRFVEGLALCLSAALHYLNARNRLEISEPLSCPNSKIFNLRSNLTEQRKKFRPLTSNAQFRVASVCCR